MPVYYRTWLRKVTINYPIINAGHFSLRPQINGLFSIVNDCSQLKDLTLNLFNPHHPEVLHAHILSPLEFLRGTEQKLDYDIDLTPRSAELMVLNSWITLRLFDRIMELQVASELKSILAQISPQFTDIFYSI